MFELEDFERMPELGDLANDWHTWEGDPDETSFPDYNRYPIQENKD